MTVDSYINQLPADRKLAIIQLREVILKNLPLGFEECINYNMPSLVVPHTIYPAGYHCNTKLPLPYISYASQKNYISFHHFGIYANEKLLNWFVSEYSNLNCGKIDMGKGCIRFKKMENIPYDLIGKLIAKISVEEWIEMYEQGVKNK